MRKIYATNEELRKLLSQLSEEKEGIMILDKDKNFVGVLLDRGQYEILKYLSGLAEEPQKLMSLLEKDKRFRGGDDFQSLELKDALKLN